MRGRQHGAVALVVSLVALGLLGFGAVLGLASAVALDAHRAQDAADAAAQRAEVGVLSLPAWVRERLSVEIQAEPARCAAGALPQVPDAPSLDGLCHRLFAIASAAVAGAGGGDAVLQGLLVEPDARDLRDGRGAGRLGVLVFVAWRHRLPGCDHLSVPRVGERGLVCWASAVAAARPA